jgi:pyrroloquinoline-quinone synthase
VELWLRFCEALNLDRQDVRVGEPNNATSELVNTYENLTTTGSLAAGAVALYAFESQVPEVAKEKIRGLVQFYNMDDPQAISFFQVHKTLDEAHSEAERDMVGSLVSSNDDETESIQAAKSATEALWRFLDSVY